MWKSNFLSDSNTSLLSKNTWKNIMQTEGWNKKW